MRSLKKLDHRRKSMKTIHNDEDILKKRVLLLFDCVFHEKEQLFLFILEHIQIEDEKLRRSMSFLEGNQICVSGSSDFNESYILSIIIIGLIN